MTQHEGKECKIWEEEEGLLGFLNPCVRLLIFFFTRLVVFLEELVPESRRLSSLKAMQVFAPLLFKKND